jgi:hypothetical protein
MKISKFIQFTLVAIILTDTVRYLSWIQIIKVENLTYLATVLNYISIFILIFIASKRRWEQWTPQTIRWIYLIWLLINLLSLVLGLFRAQDYWDWKFFFLSSISFSFISLTFFIGNKTQLAKISFCFVLKYLFPLGFLFIPLSLVTNEQLYSRLMIPVSLFLLFIPYLKVKWRLLIILVALTSILLVLGFRTNMIKISFSLIILMLYYFRNILKLGWIKLLQISFFVIPIILLVFAIRGKYNILSDIESKGTSYTVMKGGKETKLLSDSRSFLYREVFLSLNKSGNWILGEGAAGSYRSTWFYDTGGAINGKRYNTEIGMLNILLRNGIIGVLVYSFLMIIVSTLAITKSNNYLSKMLGLYIASWFLLSFIEEYTQYDLNFYFFWIVIGLVSSRNFRAMSDLQIKKYFPI